MTRAVRFIATSLLVSMLSFPVYADVIVNEVLANEPGSFVQLEWIELYNSSDSAADMIDYNMIAGGTEITFPTDLTLEPRQYFIVCRRLYGDSASPGFEDTWGDTSGIWGDTEFEQGIPAPLEASFSLRNSADTVSLFDADTLVSELIWSEAGSDGTSWERLEPDSDSIIQSVAVSGSTPGTVNSRAPVRFDIAITRFYWGRFPFEESVVGVCITLENQGTDTVHNFDVAVTRGDGTIIREYPIEFWPPQSVSVSTVIQADRPGVYTSFRAGLSITDDRPENNIREFTTMGEDFPPIILSEVFANPNELTTSEWIEIQNISLEAFDLSDWKISDEIKTVPITGSDFLIIPGEFVILCDDSAGFRSSYPQVICRVLEVASWPTLNNDADVVRLYDAYDFQADLFRYSEVFDDGRTWSRAESRKTVWGRSSDIGGTPGAPNKVTVFEDVTSVSLQLHGRKISSNYPIPIYAAAPLGSTYTLKIFDRQGRVVRTIVEDADYLAESYEWDGTSDSGNRLPLGLYIVYFEAVGYGSAKETVAIVR